MARSGPSVGLRRGSVLYIFGAKESEARVVGPSDLAKSLLEFRGEEEWFRGCGTRLPKGAVNRLTGKRNPRLFVPVVATKSNGLVKSSSIDSFQLRAISTDRVAKHLEYVDEHVMDEVRRRIAFVLDIGEEHVS